MTINGTNYIYETGHRTMVRSSQDWKTFSSESIEQTNMQLHVTQWLKGGYNKFQLVLKDNPGSRKCPILGHKGQRDVLLCGFIAEDKFLLKMRTDRTDDTFWTLLDSTGKIHSLPRTLHRVLYSDEWTSMKSQPIKNYQNQLLFKSSKTMAAFRFDSSGNFLDYVTFSAQHPEVSLIANKFYGNYDGGLF